MLNQFWSFFTPDADAVVQLRLFTLQAAGLCLVSAILVTRPGAAAVAGAVVMGTSLLLAGSARPSHPPLIPFATWMTIASAGGAGGTAALHWLLRNRSIPGVRAVGGWLGRTLSPEVWAELAGRPQSVEDRHTLLRGVLAATAGGIVGTLLCQEEFASALRDAATPRGLTAIVVLGFLAALFLEPVHALVSRSMAGAPVAPNEDADASGELWSRLSRSSLASGLGLCVILVIFNLTQGSLEQVLRSGNPVAIWGIFSGGLLPALATYYWIAAIQIDAPAIWRKVAWPMTLLMVIMYVPTGIYFLFLEQNEYGQTHVDAFAEDGLIYQAAFVAIAVAVGLVVTAAVCFLVFTFPVICGAWALDRAHDRRTIWILFVAVLVGTLPTLGGFYGLDLFSGGRLPWYSYLSFVLGAIGWLSSLWLAGLVRYACERRSRLASSLSLQPT
jgi:hypothetical protein